LRCSGIGIGGLDAATHAPEQIDFPRRTRVDRDAVDIAIAAGDAG
jgi:hypothetical protein